MKCVLGFVGMLLIVAASYGVRLVHAETKSKMRTLHFGPVTPPAPGEEFDMRRWLKSAMPTREDRCPSKGQGAETTTATYSDEPVEQTTTEDIANAEPTTVTYSDEPVEQTTTKDMDTACVTFEAKQDSQNIYPTGGRFDPRLKRLDFSVVRTKRVNGYEYKNTPGLLLFLWGPTNQTVGSMYFTDGNCSISTVNSGEGFDTHVDCKIIGGSGRYWVEVTDNEVQLGNHGDSALLSKACSIEIWSIGLYGVGGDTYNATIYAPCY